MTELIDSLLEFSRNRAALHPTYGNLQDAVDNAVEAVQSNPEFHDVAINVRKVGNIDGWFDHRKLERAFFNLVLNACESVTPKSGRIEVDLHETENGVEIRVADNGHGIPSSIRDTLFDPFVSEGKENGTGLGLTVVQKIVQDHGGEVSVAQTSSEGTVFRITLPRPAPAAGNEPSVSEPGTSELGTSEDASSPAAASVNSTRQG
jgi:signal transduction histidine kinase